MDSFHELFAVRRNRRALAIACLLQGLQQLCGFVGVFLAWFCVCKADFTLELADVLFAFSPPGRSDQAQ